MQVALDREAIEGFAAQRGFTDTLRALNVNQSRQRLLELIRVHDALQREAPDLLDQTGFGVAYRQFKGQPQAAMNWVVSYPAFGFWCRVAYELIERDAHIKMPGLHIASHLRTFPRYLLSAAWKSQSVLETPVAVDVHGNLVLPGWRLALILGIDFAGRTVLCRVKRDVLEIDLRGQSTVTIPQSALGDAVSEDRLLAEMKSKGVLVRFPRVAAGFIEVNDSDDDLRLPGRVKAEFQPLDDVSTVEWQEMLSEAWETLLDTDAALAAEIRATLKVIVPVVSSNPTKHLSATYSETWGTVHMSYSRRVAVILEALVHEYMHNKLNTLLSVDPVIVGPTNEAIFYSPFRSDPRPLLGLLHGIFAFHGVTRFWEVFLRRPQAHADGAWVQRRALELYCKVQIAINDLQSVAQLTPIGKTLLDTIAESSAGVALPAVSSSAFEELKQHEVVQRENWEKLYGRSTATIGEA
jgi:HEXXH motif-containing protein